MISTKQADTSVTDEINKVTSIIYWVHFCVATLEIALHNNIDGQLFKLTILIYESCLLYSCYWKVTVVFVTQTRNQSINQRVDLGLYRLAALK